MPAPILRRPLDVEVDVVAAFRVLTRDPGPADGAFWLDAGPHAARGMSWIGTAAEVVRCSSWAAVFAAVEGSIGRTDHPGTAIDEAANQPAVGRNPGAPWGADAAFRLGWVGWLAYELGTLDEERARPAPDDARSDRAEELAVLLRIDRALEFDHATGRAALLALDEPGAGEWLDAMQAALNEAAAIPTAPESQGDRRVTLPAAPAPDAHPGPTTATPRHTAAEYAALVDACKATITRGDAYQLCLTNTWRVPTPAPLDPLDTYLRLRAVTPSHHGGLLIAGDTALLSASPECFLSVTATGHVSTSPVKGTRRRGAGPIDDALLRRELAASAKEQAENLMIVDLMRNDLSRVCVLGTVRVSALLEVETLPAVHQLVSTVEGELALGASGLDAVAACFPAGSMTGAPKRSAMQTLAALEGAPRGIYSGAFGFFSSDGAVELAMVIRSIVLGPGGATVGAGGGITALSEAADEVDETVLKARPLLAVLGATPTAGAAPAAMSAAPVPDPPAVVAAPEKAR